MEAKDYCRRDHEARLFRVSDVESSEILHLIFYNAAVHPAPPDDGTEVSFISFWDDNIQKILELLVPSGKSIQDSSHHTSAQKWTRLWLFKGQCLPFLGGRETPK